ncbi:Glycosyltransferase [Sulfidibacter corallicola]|uniref:Glycosyltransferase n=1 Tax=Sulfidibacter corallicola TaxID=2818388 RepID=A0A8A4TW72_SULCO|nr:glycosyltransferase [Sulfidibacter corallicola]QTD54206.1 glycosyltransferase [Sulfidibacter corallicola]
MQPKVSVVMTVFNRQDYLGQAVQSVLAQTFPDFELIIVDDGSTDASPLIAQRFALRDSRIQFEARPHRGRIPALADAMELATGDYVGWVDSDDLLEPEALAETVRFLERHHHVGLVYTDYLDIDDEGHVLGIGSRCRVPFSHHGLLRTFMTFHFRLFRRSLFDQIGGLTDAVPMAEDYDFCLRASEVARFGRIRKPLYRYRKHANRVTDTHRLAQIHGAKEAIRRALARRGLDAQWNLHLELRGQFELRRKSS